MEIHGCFARYREHRAVGDASLAIERLWRIWSVDRA
jgi:hypothetical protein